MAVVTMRLEAAHELGVDRGDIAYDLHSVGARLL